MKRQYITAREISEIMGTSQGQAYKFIRQMNQELKEQGFLIVAGKVPIAYFKTKCFGVEFEEGEARQQNKAVRITVPLGQQKISYFGQGMNPFSF